MPFEDREGFIQLLDRLGDPDDAQVLAAAREIHRRMTEAGLSWDEALAWPEDDSWDEESDPDSTPGPAAAAALPDGAETEAGLIDRLLRDMALTDQTREELLAFKQDLAAGRLAPMDRSYIRALYARLAGQAKPPEGHSKD